MNNEQVKVWKEATVVLCQSQQGLTKAKKKSVTAAGFRDKIKTLKLLE
jgi:hypothetical protein